MMNLRGLFAIAAILASVAHGAENSPAKPNILVIFADDVGWGDASCYGAEKVKTPNIDRLAREGVRFEHGHASASVCTPTRYSLLTGQYSWRRKGEGLDKGVSNGDSPLLIPTSMVTAPGLLKEAGYRSALIGKWHLGFGEGAPDYNQALRPGPLEVGFDAFFGIPATNDRIPTVLVRDHRVVGLDPADPIEISYAKDPAKREGLSPWAAGRNRIGWGKGGKAAWWKDTELADTFTAECVRFLEENQKRPFFLLYAPHNVHAPTIPHPRFKGRSGLGDRADMLLEFDAAVGELLGTLDRLGLAKDTLVIYSSDNGAYKNDEQGHRPTGPFRGIKSQLWEGGHRVPFVVRWPARIQPGVSKDLVSTIDIPATVCAAAGIQPPGSSLPDSFNLLPAMLGEKDAKRRERLVVMSGTGHLALLTPELKWIPNLADANGWQGAGKPQAKGPKGPGLFDLTKDPGETRNLHKERPAEARKLAGWLEEEKSKTLTRPR